LLNRTYRLATTRSKRRLTFFLDGIQNVGLWQKWLNMQLEMGSGHCFVVSSSNSQLLVSELPSPLTGRYLRYEPFQFDLNEFHHLVTSGKREQYSLY
jgi:predicted AAA+ superfamily ATPase